MKTLLKIDAFFTKLISKMPKWIILMLVVIFIFVPMAIGLMIKSILLGMLIAISGYLIAVSIAFKDAVKDKKNENV
jgi:hypothetical protein